jgi:hypothetical protein
MEKGKFPWLKVKQSVAVSTSAKEKGETAMAHVDRVGGAVWPDHWRQR